MKLLLLGPAAVLALVLAGCGGSTTASPTVRPTGGPAATPRPSHSAQVFASRPLIDVHGTQHDFVTKEFHATNKWHVVYSARCTYVSNMDPEGGIVQILGDDPRHPNGPELGIVYSLGFSGKLETGTSPLQSRGPWKLHIETGPGCKWHVQVRQLA